MSPEKKKQTGSFYTIDVIVDSMCRWAIRNNGDRLLEPSFGEGIFIEKSIDRFNELGNHRPDITAVEIQENVAEIFRKKKIIDTLNIINDDFMSFLFLAKFDAVIGNPPYISLKNVSREQQSTARKIIVQYLSQFSNNGSLWFPFVLKSISLLKSDGRLAFVLPFELTYTRYASGLWKILTQNFSSLTVTRIYEDFFPDVDVEAILLYAEGKGGKTNHVTYQIFDKIDDFTQSINSQSTKVMLSEIVNNEKPFITKTLNQTLQHQVLKMRNKGLIKPIIESCKFKIGYVSADKDFFHPHIETVNNFNLPDVNLIPTILNAKAINGGTSIGLEVFDGDCLSRLYYPKIVTDHDRDYIHHGEKRNVHKKYKCQQRKPWYITPNIEIPDIILTVFGDTPKLIANKGKYAVANSLLSGFLKEGSQEQFICRWYNSLTLLSLEMTIHSLGGGSLVIIPGEADRLNIINYIPEKMVEPIFTKFNDAMIKCGADHVYRLGDRIVLQDIFGVSEEDLASIRESIRLLREWRNPRKRRNISEHQRRRIICYDQNKSYFELVKL